MKKSKFTGDTEIKHVVATIPTFIRTDTVHAGISTKSPPISPVTSARSKTYSNSSNSHANMNSNTNTNPNTNTASDLNDAAKKIVEVIK